MNPGISIIIPTYNSAAYLPQAIKSVLAQGYAPFEIIVVDDGSIDETTVALKPYVDKVKYVRQENSGSAAARNRGLRLATHELVLFLDADDLLLPDKLQQQAAFLQLQPEIGYVSSGWQQIDEAGQVLLTVEPWQHAPNLALEDWLQYKPVQLGAILFRRIWLNRVGGLNPSLRQAHDVDLMLRLSLAGCQGAWLYQPTLQYRQHQASTMRKTAVQTQSVLQVLQNFFATPNLPNHLRQQKSNTYFYTLLWLGWHAAVHGDVATAVSTLQQSHTFAQKRANLAIVHTVVEWLFHFVQWEWENGRTAPLPDTIWPIFEQAAPKITVWPELKRLATWWQAEQPATVRQAYTPFDLWRIFQSGLDWEQGNTELTAELILEWWALVWQPYAHKQFDLAFAGWAHFSHLDQLRLVQLVRVGLAAEPDAVDSNALSQLWQDACTHGLRLEDGFDEPAFFAALSGVRPPRVSVIVPVYNGAAHIVETVESVLAQTYTDLELIVVDDGSTDGTADLLRPYRGQIRLIQQENQGVSAARNYGLRLALGDFVLFLDGDDVLYPDKLAQQVATLEEDHLLGAVHSGWRLVDEYGRPLRNVQPWAQTATLDLKAWLQWKPVFLGAMLFRRSWLQRIDGFRSDLRQAEDTDFLLRLSLAGCRMRWLEVMTIDYRQHGAGVTQNGRRQAKDMLTVLADFFSRQELPLHIQAMEPAVQQYTLIWLVWQLQRTGYPDEIVPYLRRATTANGEHPPTILAQTWLVQLASYGRSEGLPLTELRTFYPHIRTALQLEDERWPAVERMLDWWLNQWPLLHSGGLGDLGQVQQVVHGGLHLEEAGHVRSAIEWVEWWLKVWHTFLPHETCGDGHQMSSFLDKTAAEVAHLAKGSIVYAPDRVEAWQIMVFWYRAQECGLIRPSDKHLVVSLYLTYFGQSLLGRQWHRAWQGLWKAIRFSTPKAKVAWSDFILSGIVYWRNGRVGSTS
ncbi:glycosyltransferase family 2 protein [Candidatus Leptofilum sp.]|uniref:glycosyltransferase family 2 protein n=1 Tax=Candidatus Leptofilum sp. TaxID=3241576 RepID=UPI003B592D71